MTKWRYLRDCESPPPHYPPPELCALLVRDHLGRPSVVDRLPTPLDERGIPDIHTMLARVAETLDRTYELPHQTNVHHLIHSRTRCAADPDLQAFRDATVLQANMPVQMHNLIHGLYEEPELPPMEDIRQFNREYASMAHAHELGRKAVRYRRISHDIMEFARTLPLSERVGERDRSRRIGQLATVNEALFWRILDEAPDSRMRVLPRKDELFAVSTGDAVTLLGKQGAGTFLDVRRTAQELIYKLGVDQNHRYQDPSETTAA